MSKLRSPFARPRPMYMTCDTGLEKLVAKELESVGARDIDVGHRGVGFLGIEETMWRANLCSRLGNRVLIPIAQFPAPEKRALYEGAKRIHWSEWFGPDQTFAVDASSHKSKLNHSGFCALVVKDAICDRFRYEGLERPNVDRKSPDVRLNLHIENNQAILSFDSSGARLHRRGYRKAAGGAPVKETLAAALLTWSQWQPHTPLLDPMCGSGTFLAEAALYAAQLAPGLLRLNGEGFGFMRTRHFDADKFRLLTEKFRERVRAPELRLVGIDIDPKMVKTAKANLGRLNLKIDLELVEGDACELDHLSFNWGDKRGFLVCNPPWGERMGEAHEIGDLYRRFGDTLAETFAADRKLLLLSEDAPLKALRQRVKQERWVNHGPIKCRWVEVENRNKR